MTGLDPQRSVEAVWRLESTRLIAALVRIVRDVGLAEDLAQEALVAALTQWTESGVPKNPGAWLMAVAKRRAIDTFRGRERQDCAYGHVGQRLEEMTQGFEDQVDHVDDDVLRLMFICCHPALTVDAQVTLTLRLMAERPGTSDARRPRRRPTVEWRRFAREWRGFGILNRSKRRICATRRSGGEWVDPEFLAVGKS